MQVLRRLLQYLSFPAIMTIAMAVFYRAFERNEGSGYAILLVVMIAVVLVVHVLERIIPYRMDWAGGDGQWLNDLGHGLIGSLVGAPFRWMTSAWAVPALIAVSQNQLGSALWPSSLPWWVQLAWLCLVAEFAKYWQHRWMHTVPLFWRMHALHHSPEKLNGMKAIRDHFTERVFKATGTFGVLALLGAPGKLVLLYMVSDFLRAFFAHSNADCRLGVLEYVISGPAAHRLHHSIDLKVSGSNYGSSILLWDIMFGTYHCPVGKPGPDRIGIADNPIPANWLRQLLSPFIWNRLTLDVAARVRSQSGG